MASKEIAKSSFLETRSEVNWDELHYEFFQNFSSENTKKCYMRDIKHHSFVQENLKMQNQLRI